MKGKLITFCGLDGCGKTTQAKLLKNYFNELGYTAEIVHAFKPNLFSGELKRIAKENNFSYYKSFSNNMRTLSFIIDLIKNVEIYKQKIEMGHILIAEKYLTDTLVYAPLLGSDISFLNDYLAIIPKPNCEFFLDISAEISIERVKERAKNENKIIAPKENILIARQARIRFQEITTINNSYRIDGEKSSQMIFDQIKKIIKEEIING